MLKGFNETQYYFLPVYDRLFEKAKRGIPNPTKKRSVFRLFEKQSVRFINTLIEYDYAIVFPILSSVFKSASHFWMKVASITVICPSPSTSAVSSITANGSLMPAIIL